MIYNLSMNNNKNNIYMKQFYKTPYSNKGISFIS